MALTIGTVLKSDGKVRAPTNAYEHILAEEDGMIHDGSDYRVSAVLDSPEADLCDLYLLDPPSVLKLVRRPNNNDLIENEARVLRQLNGSVKGGSTFEHYFPKLLQTVKQDGCSGNIVSYLEGYISVADVMRSFPAGVDFKDMVWMYKRLLVGLGYAHSQGVLHGAVLPPHVLVHPTGHGGTIVDWSYAVTDPKDHLKAWSTAYEDFYAPEIFEKSQLTPGTDLYMAAKCAVALLGGNVRAGTIPDSVPVEIREFFYPSLERLSRHRPTNAWDLHERFDAVLRKVVGEPEYRPLILPDIKLG